MANQVRIRKKLGDIIEIFVHGEYYCYSQLLLHGQYVFFDYKSDLPLNDYSILETCPWLFRATLYNSVIRRYGWKIVGNIPIREEFLVPPMEYIYDKFENTFDLYNVETGAITKCTKEEARGLERCAVWDGIHIEDRLYDHYRNQPCIWLKEEYELWGLMEH